MSKIVILYILVSRCRKEDELKYFELNDTVLFLGVYCVSFNHGYH